jgi:competence protein ComEC
MSVDIHFLNVGHGDCTFVDFDGDHLAMIDINNSKSLPELDQIALAQSRGVSLPVFKTVRQAGIGYRTWEEGYRSLLVDPFDYYQEHFAGRSVFRYIQTHPDMDHMGGLHRFFWQENVPLLNFWDQDHTRVRSEEDFQGTRHAYVDWAVYELLRRGKGKNDSEHNVLRLMRGNTGHYWTEDGLTIMSPTHDLVASCDKADVYNNASYVVRIDHGGRRIILPGDAEADAWEDILDELGPSELSCDVLKAAHHGRQSGYYEPAAEAMDPSVVVCSVGKKPETDATDEYEAMGAKVLSTRYRGTITVRLWHDGEVWVENRKGERIHTLPPLTS